MKSIARLFFATAFVWAGSISVAAQTSPVAGKWQGTLTIPGQKFAAVIRITEPAAGQLTGSRSTRRGRKQFAVGPLNLC